MGQHYTEITERLAQFIAEQHVFFVGTAAADGCVNLSPKGMDSLRVLGKQRVIWLNVTGSGNETAAHVLQHPRMTLMFCAFQGSPMILRVYGTARVIHHNDDAWPGLMSLLNPIPGARQIFDLQVDRVQTSCGMAVPFFDYRGEREQLWQWAEKKGDDGLRDYWSEKNRFSIDGLPTHIVEKNL